jgi:hypothetical protein
LCRVATLVLFLVASAPPAFAHSSARGFVLLLPTHYVIIGGTLAVLATFVAISLLPDRLFHRAVQAGLDLIQINASLSAAISLLSAAILIGLVWIGFTGPYDPAENLLPLAIWSLWWVVIVLAHPLFGNLWSFLNPFSGIHALTRMKPPLTFPERLNYVPAIVLFAVFAWFQLVYPAPEDPPRLAMVVSAYAALTLIAVFTFGAEAWLTKADPFGVFLTQLSAAAPLRLGKHLGLCAPGADLVRRPALPLAGTLFVLLTLSTISFDGLANTFLWLSGIGINPLDYPGRTALVPANTLGLAASFACLAALYFVCVWAGWHWAGKPGSLSGHLGRFIYSLIPISIAYHFSHYLSDTLVNLQYLVLALNDPFGTGANLLGLGQYHVTASFQNTSSGTFALYVAQTVAIIAGHIIGVGVAHAMVAQEELPRALARKLEMPLTALMVLYTSFGLWLLSTPSIS